MQGSRNASLTGAVAVLGVHGGEERKLVYTYTKRWPVLCFELLNVASKYYETSRMFGVFSLLFEAFLWAFDFDVVSQQPDDTSGWSYLYCALNFLNVPYVRRH